MLVISLLVSSCDSSNHQLPGEDSFIIDTPEAPACDLNPSFLTSVLGRDVIPALSDPTLVSANTPTYLSKDDLVLGIEVDNMVFAIPHNILWHHEVINFNTLTIPISVTYCPLTGSGLVFDRSDLNGLEFGVSGLLYRNNLVLFDRKADESLWPQLSRTSRCGPAFSTELFTIPAFEMTWNAWKTLHPSTKIVSSSTGHARDYTRNPYGNYDEPENRTLLIDMEIDERRPPKERTLVLPDGDGGLAFPFGLLDNGTSTRVIHTTFRSQEIVVFWSKTMKTAMAYSISTTSQARSFTATNNTFTDAETGSVWRIDGRAVEGPLKGNRLKPVGNAYIAFWFAWAAFHPKTIIWESNES